LTPAYDAYAAVLEASESDTSPDTTPEVTIAYDYIMVEGIAMAVPSEV